MQILEYDLDKTRTQVRQIEDIRDQLFSQIGNYEETIQDISLVWSGDSANAYLDKADKVREKMDKLKKDMDSTIVSFQKKIKSVEKTEQWAKELTIKRTY